MNVIKVGVHSLTIAFTLQKISEAVSGHGFDLTEEHTNLMLMAVDGLSLFKLLKTELQKIQQQKND